MFEETQAEVVGRGDDKNKGKNIMVNIPRYRKRTIYTQYAGSLADKYTALKEAQAVFHELPRRCITAGCPKDICKKCGFIREKVYKNGEFIATGGSRVKDTPGISDKAKQEGTGYHEKIETSYTSCDCNAGYHPGIVLDPFMGSGTTALAAKQLNRNWVGIELNEKYIKMAEERINREPEPLF